MTTRILVAKAVNLEGQAQCGPLDRIGGISSSRSQVAFIAYSLDSILF